MTAGLRFFFRHIYVTGLRNIPSKGPVIIIANHNSSLMDAALLGILLKRKAYFFARGDVFVNKPIRTILWWLHMMPVHGHQGGRTTLSANTNSFSDGQRILTNGGIVVFFPESTSHTEHQLLPFRKGVFRLAFDTAVANHFSFDIPVVPIGITYNDPVACRTNVQVHAGQPLLLSSYKNEYTRNAATALLHICKDAHQAISKLVIHIADKNRLQTAEQYLIICKNNYPDLRSAWKIESAKELGLEQNICGAINNTPEAAFENKKQQVNKYFSALSAAGVADKTIAASFSFPAWKKTALWMGFPFYIIGLLLNGLPVLVARQIANKKVYRKDFYSWIFVACYSFMYFFWLLFLLLASFLFGWQYAAGSLVLIIITGIFSYQYKDWLKDNRQSGNWRKIPVSRQNQFTTMRADLQ